jgi:hypothetical protein
MRLSSLQSANYQSRQRELDEQLFDFCVIIRSRAVGERQPVRAAGDRAAAAANGHLRSLEFPPLSRHWNAFLWPQALVQYATRQLVSRLAAQLVLRFFDRGGDPLRLLSWVACEH